MTKSLHVLCYEHHTVMKQGQILVKAEGGTEWKLVYACSEPGCMVHYSSNPQGYFVIQHQTPRVRCPHDGMPMYLAEVRPESTSFRLWRCPQCDNSRTNQDSSEA
jgi:hypothetical protein